MRDEANWYPRFADIPEIQYIPLISVNQKNLWGRGARPKVERYNFDGKQHISMMWLAPDGTSTSASPAKQRSLTLNDPTPTDILAHLSETLELPGTASDYHFTLQDAHESFWRQRKVQPSVYNTIETICQLDIALVALLGQDMYGDSPFAVSAFSRLAGIYETEGLLGEALAVYDQAEAGGHFVRTSRAEQLRTVLGGGT